MRMPKNEIKPIYERLDNIITLFHGLDKKVAVLIDHAEITNGRVSKNETKIEKNNGKIEENSRSLIRWVSLITGIGVGINVILQFIKII